MHLGSTTSKKSTTVKALAALTTAGVLLFGGASAAVAADGGSGTSTGRSVTVGREHPGAFRGALRTAFSAAAQTLGMTGRELRTAVLDGPQSVASVAGDQAPEVTAAVQAALGGRIDTAEANGSITTDQAANLRERVPAAAERFMSKVPAGRAA